MSQKYTAKGLVVHKEPGKKKMGDGSTAYTLGFPVCEVTDWVGEDGAMTVAKLLSAADGVDTNLIDAAPDLLASLKDAIEIIEKHVPRDALGVDHMGDFSVPGGVMTWGVLDEHLHYMRKAIDRAEGRS